MHHVFRSKVTYRVSPKKNLGKPIHFATVMMRLCMQLQPIGPVLSPPLTIGLVPGHLCTHNCPSRLLLTFLPLHVLRQMPTTQRPLFLKRILLAGVTILDPVTVCPLHFANYGVLTFTGAHLLQWYKSTCLLVQKYKY